MDKFLVENNWEKVNKVETNHGSRCFCGAYQFH
jgi:hypothetical protein